VDGQKQDFNINKNDIQTVNSTRSMGKELFPRTNAGFAEYIKIAYRKVSENLSAYAISPVQLAQITPFYEDYIAMEALAANPDTAQRATARRATMPTGRWIRSGGSS
jgi:hypothetical protein